MAVIIGFHHSCGSFVHFASPFSDLAVQNAAVKVVSAAMGIIVS